jgi:hypothetical protein
MLRRPNWLPRNRQFHPLCVRSTVDKQLDRHAEIERSARCEVPGSSACCPRCRRGQWFRLCCSRWSRAVRPLLRGSLCVRREPPERLRCIANRPGPRHALHRTLAELLVVHCSGAASGWGRPLRQCDLGEMGARRGKRALRSKRLGQDSFAVPLPPSGRGRPQPVRKNELRPTPGLLRISYLVLALLASAAAAVAEGSAKAITASPSSKLLPGSPPKP